MRKVTITPEQMEAVRKQRDEYQIDFEEAAMVLTSNPGGKNPDMRKFCGDSEPLHQMTLSEVEAVWFHTCFIVIEPRTVPESDRRVTCANCDLTLTDKTEIEYSRALRQFYCNPGCATDQYFKNMGSIPLESLDEERADVHFVDGVLCYTK